MHDPWSKESRALFQKGVVVLEKLRQVQPPLPVVHRGRLQSSGEKVLEVNGLLPNSLFLFFLTFQKLEKERQFFVHPENFISNRKVNKNANYVVWYGGIVLCSMAWYGTWQFSWPTSPEGATPRFCIPLPLFAPHQRQNGRGWIRRKSIAPSSPGRPSPDPVGVQSSLTSHPCKCHRGLRDKETLSTLEIRGQQERNGSSLSVLVAVAEIYPKSRQGFEWS